MPSGVDGEDRCCTEICMKNKVQGFVGLVELENLMRKRLKSGTTSCYLDKILHNIGCNGLKMYLV